VDVFFTLHAEGDKDRDAMRQQESEDAEHVQKNEPLIQINTPFADDATKPGFTASSVPQITQEPPPRLH
jgi:hypothetical protein